MLKNMTDSKGSNTLDIERLIIYTIVLLTIIVFIIQTDLSIIAIIPFTVIYFFVVINYLVIPFLQKENFKNKNLVFVDNLPNGFEYFKKISRKHYSFDNEIFYVINEYEQKVIAIPFADIREVRRTAVKIRNRRFWKVIALHNNKELTFKFRHNYTFWNNNFPAFLRKLKRVNPAVVTSRWNVWKM